MTFLPIVERELRVAARKRNTYWFRLVAAGVVVLTWYLLSASARAGSQQSSFMVFLALALGAFVVCLLAGAILTADCVSEEKREGTLGLLFLADLKGHDVLLGKLTATSLRSFYCLLAVLPMMALPLLTGGVSLGMFWRVALSLVVTLFFSLSVGLCVSVVSHQTRQAMWGTVLIVLILTGLPWLLWWLIQLRLNPGGSIPNSLLWSSPVFTFRAALYDDVVVGFASTAPARWWAISFWISCGVTSCLSFGALAVASLLIPRVWSNTTEVSPKRFLIARNCVPVDEAKRRAWQPLLDENPFYWLLRRDRSPHVLLRKMFGVMLPIWVCFLAGCFASTRATSEKFFMVAVFMTYGLHVMFKSFVAAEASRRFSEDSQNSMLELLLVSPLSLAQIIDGQHRALRRLSLAPMTLLCLTNVALCGLVWCRVVEFDSEGRMALTLMLILGAVLLVFDCFALYWVGMWTALQTQRHHRAILKTLRTVMLVPWLGIAFLLFLAFTGAVMRPEAIARVFVLWCGVSILIDMTTGFNAGSNLRARLRATASDYGVKVLAASAPEDFFRAPPQRSSG